MKCSIKKVFNNIFLHSLFILLFSVFSLLMLFDANLSNKKTEVLLSQKNSMIKLVKLETEGDELAGIQFKGISTQLTNSIQKLHNITKYNYINSIFLQKDNEYTNSLNKLKRETDTFIQSTNKFLFDETVEDTEKLEAQLELSYNTLNKHIEYMLIQELLNNQAKFSLNSTILIALTFLILAFIIIYKQKLNQIYKDILFLYSVESNQKKHKIVCEEMDAIALRMKRKPVLSDDPNMIDKVTGIFNQQGLVHNYKNKKSMREDNPIAITIFEIDNFSRTNRKYSQDAIQAILKKVAYTFSLYEQPTDIIARSDFNQFTLILVRGTKKELISEVEKIQQNISELKFNIPNVGSINVTLSGGYVIKTTKMNFEEAFKICHKALNMVKSNGGDKLLQERDMKMMEEITS